MERLTFPAMGTTVEFLLAAPPGRAARRALATARDEVLRLERLFSRFRPDSELSRLNRAGSMRIGADMQRVLGRALELRALTGGLFDPTVGRAIAALGYDRTFPRLAPDSPSAAPRPATGAVHLDALSGRVELGSGVAIDLGAIAKGDAADRACALAGAAGPCLANVGGDIAVSAPRMEGPWPIALNTGNGDIVLNLSRGALATSGTDRRRWRRGGREIHHAVAPESGECAPTDLVRVTAVCATGADADARATALLVAGSTRAAALAERWRMPALLVGASGAARATGGLA